MTKENICTFSHNMALYFQPMLFHFPNTVGKFSPIAYSSVHICGVHHWLRLLYEDWHVVK